MAISGASGGSTLNFNTSKPIGGPGSSGGSGGDDLLGQAEAVAREGFLLSLKAKQITNKYAAAKEVR
ncbi:hypothetical protein [Pseudomonas sp. S1_E04]